MPGLIPQNCLDDILNRIDIVEVISGYMPLKKAGRNFKTNCPFHHEKTPSFTVSPERQIYHCFGCGESGNAFKFLMRYERLDFPEAVEMLAKKAGVALPKAREQDPKVTSLSTQLFKINELAASFYASALQSGGASSAKSYLLKRGLTEETLALFNVGFAFDKWDALINYARAKQIGLTLLEKAGLVLAKDNGGYYDRFRNRIIFPIFDIKSRALGFGARVLDATLPKYVNSPETPIYIKGKNLYGLPVAKDAIKECDSVVIVEGYLDCIMPYQQGLRNIVASLGTALTVDQVRLLKRYTHNAVMVYDGDAAGELAALRSLDMFIEEGMDVKVVSLPQGFDPDLFVRKHGIEDFRKRIAAAVDLFDYKLKMLKARYPAREIHGKANIATEMLISVNKFKHPVLKSEYIKRLADELHVREDALLSELKNIKPDAQPRSFTAPVSRKASVANPTERLLIKLMMEESALISHVKESLAPADFQDEGIARIVSLLFELVEQGKSIEPRSLVNYLDDESLMQFVCESALPTQDTPEHKERMLEDCIHRLKVQKVTSKRQLLHEQIKVAQAAGDEQQMHDLMREFHNLIKMKPHPAEKPG